MNTDFTTDPGHLRLEDMPRGRPIHLSGIGGEGMRGLARILRQLGFPVTGTDLRRDEVLGDLAPLGIDVGPAQDGSCILPDAQLVVATAALPADHPELTAARARGIPVVKYSRMLAALLANRDGVAVAGTHGKTTTTAMTVSALRAAGVDAGFLLGGRLPALGAGADIGSARAFVAEACEYDRSFLALAPRQAVILNIDTDHLDVYGSLECIREAFASFARLVTPDGAVFHWADDPTLERLLAGGHARRSSFGLRADADLRAEVLDEDQRGTEFAVHSRGVRMGTVRLPVPGRHNVVNALAALAVGLDRGLPFRDLAAGLAAFGGVCRRFEFKGEAGGVTVIDDYAHHPTEIGALLAAARQRYPGRRLVVVFQPHQPSRTRALAGDFAAVLAGEAELVVLTDAYVARGAGDDRRTSDELARDIGARGGAVEYVPLLDDVPRALSLVLRSGDVLLTVGAGDVHRAGEVFLEKRG